MECDSNLEGVMHHSTGKLSHFPLYHEAMNEKQDEDDILTGKMHSNTLTSQQTAAQIHQQNYRNIAKIRALLHVQHTRIRSGTCSDKHSAQVPGSSPVCKQKAY